MFASGDGRRGGAPVRGGSAAPDGASDAGKGRADPGGHARGGEPVPEALLAASGSGLDPDLPPDAVQWQLPRIAQARGIAVERLEALAATATIRPDLGFLGEPRVNVLAFNLALDRQFPLAGRPPAADPPP